MQKEHVDSMPVFFQDFGLDASLLTVIEKQGFERATLIQSRSIPVILSGRDVMGVAQTGTGKTASFVLPILQKLIPFSNVSPSPAKHPVRALILTPTRELAHQVAENVMFYAQTTALKVAVLFGGVELQQQLNVLQAGVEVVIATPGRLLDHLQQKNLSLTQVSTLVLDEADRMLDMGFMPDLLQIMDYLPKNRQTLLFSATFSKEIKALTTQFLNQPEVIEVAQTNSLSENVSQRVFSVATLNKQNALLDILKTQNLRQVIVFTNSKLGASRLARFLSHHQLSVAEIHGNKTQRERMQVLESFKQGEIEVLVATDVAARGLDVAELPAVINFDLPFNAEDYVHRIGRTGRAGVKGQAISLCSPEEERFLNNIQKLTKHAFKLEPYRVQPVAQSSRKTGKKRYSSPVDVIFDAPYEATKTVERSTQKQSITARLAVLLGGRGR